MSFGSMSWSTMVKVYCCVARLIWWMSLNGSECDDLLFSDYFFQFCMGASAGGGVWSQDREAAAPKTQELHLVPPCRF